MVFPSFPLSYSIEITWACNSSCPACVNVLGVSHTECLKEWQVLFDIIAPPENRRQYAELLRLTGGEPTLHPEFRQLVEYVDTFDIPHAIFTNGRWQNPTEIIEVVRQCQNSLGLLVSLHGATAATHQMFSGGNPASFEATCANIQRATGAGIDIFTNTVLTQANCCQIEEILALSQQLGASCAVFNRYLGKPHPLEPTPAQLRQAIHLIEDLQSQGATCHLGDCVPPCFEKNSSLGSNGGFEHCIISPDGLVRPDNLTSYSFGNLYEQSIEDIWQSEKAQWYRRQVAAQCLICAEFSRCRGGCRSLMVEHALPNDPLMQEPLQESQLTTIELDSGWKILSAFTIRPESFGYLLCRVNWSVPVTPDAKPLVEAIQQEPTIAQLHQQFGDDALELLGHLYRNGLVEFESH